jgi:hypothetical protein
MCPLGLLSQRIYIYALGVSFCLFSFFKESGVGEHSATYPHLGPRSEWSWLAPSNANTSPYRVWGSRGRFQKCHHMNWGFFIKLPSCFQLSKGLTRVTSLSLMTSPSYAMTGCNRWVTNIKFCSFDLHE